MKSFRFVKRLSRTSNTPLQVVDRCKIGEQINIKVKLVSSNKEKFATKRTKLTPSTTIASSLYSEENTNAPVKVFVSLSNSNIRKPDDFIEPDTDLAIPSTNVFMQYRNLSEPVPEIIDNQMKSRLKTKGSRLCEPNPTIAKKKTLGKRISSSLDLRTFGSNSESYKIVKKPISKNIFRKTK